MRFGRVPLDEALGAVLAHTLRTGDGVLKKGRRLGAAEVRALREAGYRDVVVARLGPDDVPEDEAAALVARAVTGPGLTVAEAFTGRANLHAAHAGVLVVDAARVDALNAIDESLTFATLAAYARLDPGELAATVKVIPFAAPGRVVAACAAVGQAVRVAPFRPHRAGIVLTRLPGTHERLLDGPQATLRARVERLGGRVAGEVRCDHHEDAVAEAIARHAADGCDLVIVLGASAPSDRGDVVPAAIERAGGEVLHLGMPVDPGNLLVLGRLGAADVLGAPGCARSLKPSGFDWVLERRAAGLPVAGPELQRMGVGGLLKEIAGRPQPRTAPVARVRPRVAAVVLAAGLSRRMGENKLLVDVDGQPMVARAVDAVLASSARPVVVVTGHQEEAVRAALAGREVELAHNPDPAAGMAGSLRAGIAALTDVDAAVVCLGDMPWVRAADIDALVAAFDPAAGRAIVVAAHQGKRGNPVLFAARFFPAMAAQGGDTGARRLLEEHAGEVHTVEIDHPGVLLDVDTREALERRSV